MDPNRPSLWLLPFLLSVAAAAPAQTRLVWNQNVNGYATVPSAAWSQPSVQDIEAADDFELTGEVHRIIVHGYQSFQSPGPSVIDGVWVRFYAWDNGTPGPLQQEFFLPEGSPRFVHTIPPTDLDVTLPQPFVASGRYFVSVQLVTPSAHSWQWWSAANGSAAVTTLGSVHTRNRGAGGDWQLYTTALGFELDLAFEIWGTSGTPPPPNPVDPCGPWQELATPPLPQNYGTTILRDLVVVDHDDVWAVGDPSVEVQFLNFETKNLALHWDGERWTEVQTPNPSVFPAPFGSTGLQGVDALASEDVWAIGNQERQDALGFVIDQPLVLRWNGSQWREVPVPNTQFDTYSYGIATLAEDDVWIVGGGVTPCGGGLALHYDGSSWELSPTPGPCSGLPGGTPGFDLEAVDGVASNDVWAVGGGSDGDFSGTTYVLHWDGSKWTYVPAPSPGFARRLFDVHARATDDVWAVGQYEVIVGSAVQFRAWAIRWDGSSWTLYDGGQVPIGSLAVHAFGPDDVYSAGGQIYHFDGTSWRVADDLGQLTGENLSVSIAGLDAVTPCHLWAAGRQDVGGQLVPFTARHEGSLYWAAGLRVCPASPGPAGGIALVDPPKVGTRFAVAIGDPQSQTGFAPGSTVTVWMLSGAAAPGGACGLSVPGFGLGGTPGALLVDLSPGVPFVLTPAIPWGGPANPAVHAVPVPAIPALVGLDLATQGVLADLGAPFPIVLTAALDATFGF